MVNSGGSEFSKQIDRVAACRITVFTRHGCHLCQVAIDLLESMRTELDFTIEKIYIEGDEKLERLYGEQIPVIHINGEHHGFFKVDPERFRSSLEKHRRRQ
ncbi:MAG: glutaredoxin family protein [Candidatus Planktophila sp.]|nr:glutaredoxin family protein [Candidatus Planktophila sp.]